MVGKMGPRLRGACHCLPELRSKCPRAGGAAEVGRRCLAARMIYRAYVLTIQGDALQYQEFDCEADEAVIWLASELIGDHAVQVEFAPRRIARLTVSRSH